MVTNSMSESTKQSASSRRRLTGLQNLSLRITTTFTLVVVIGLLLSLFHVLGFLFSVILLLFVIQNWMRTRRNYIRNFNSALRTTIEINGSIEKTARAFSMSGPLRSRCKRYADRLSQGDDPLVAAAHCRVPLEIQTAMAFSIPQKRTGSEKTRNDTELGNRVTGQSSSLAITSQLYYILFVCIAIVICTTFYNIFITPTMQMLMQDFDITAVVEQSYDTEETLIPYTGQGNAWSQWASALVAMGIAFGTLMFYLIAVVGIFPALITASWIPLLPVVAARKGAILNGLADAIDAGVPLKDFCELGLITFWHGKRRPFLLALIPSRKVIARPAASQRRAGSNKPIAAYLKAQILNACPKTFAISPVRILREPMQISVGSLLSCSRQAFSASPLLWRPTQQHFSPNSTHSP